jgi:hypothetical protein
LAAIAARDRASKQVAALREVVTSLRALTAMKELQLQEVEREFVQQATAVAAITEQQAVEARRLAAAGVAAPGSPLWHTSSAGLAAPGFPARVLEAVSTLQQFLPPSSAAQFSAWMQPQPADVNYDMAFGVASSPTGIGDLAVADPCGNEEFLSTQGYPNLLGEVLIRDSILRGNAVPQLSTAEVSLLQEVHAANAVAQAPEAVAAAATRPVYFAGRAMSSFGAARPPRVPRAAAFATADAGAAVAAAEAARLAAPSSDVIEVGESGQGAEP